VSGVREKKPEFCELTDYIKWGFNMDIKVLGPGCPKCHTLEKNTREAVKDLGLEAEVSKVTDVNEIAGYGVFITPGLVVDGEVKLAGKVATKNQIKKLLSE
jgi:small redox-active disulfide protein 2